MYSLKQVLENPDPQMACAAANAAHHAPPDMMDIPVQQLLDQLVEQRSEVSDHDPELSRLDGMIIPLMTITRKMFSAGPYDIIRGSPPSSPQAPEGSMLQDLKEINLWEEASGLLEVEYLSTAVPVVVGGPWRAVRPMQAPARVPADPVAPEFALHKRLLSGGHRGPRV